VKWFGDPWPSDELRASVCESPNDRVGTPEGEPCLWCDEPIAENDRGVILPVGDLDSDGRFFTTIRPCHIECNVRSVVGSLDHLTGHCSCSGKEPVSGLSSREDALAVWDWVQSHG
jgi:hypothetical protein